MLSRINIRDLWSRVYTAFLLRRKKTEILAKRLHFCILFFLSFMLVACSSEQVQLIQLVSVKSLSSTSVELVFDDILGDSGNISGNYSIEGLTVQKAQVADASVVLTTSAQINQTYTVTVGAVTSKDGAALNTATRSRSFQGIASTTQPTEPPGERLKLLRVQSLSSTKIELTFNEPVGSSGSNTSNYSIEGLTVIQAVVQSRSGLSPSANTAVPITVIPNGSIVKLTTSTQSNRSYTVRLSNITSAAGNPLDSQASSASFQGKATSELTKLELSSAQSTSSTEVKLLFNRLVGSSGNVAENYSIDGLTILEASVDRVLVTLKTSVQADRTYVVNVSNVIASDGSALDDQLNSKSFVGAAPVKASNTAVHLVNLSQSLNGLGSCDKGEDRASTARCVASGIRGELGSEIDSFDVFVPGTGAENGSWRQFNSMNLPVPGRAYLALKYQDEIFSLSNAAQYDNSVIAGRAALIDLLYTLNREFPEAKVRVFGHSKGAHIVSLVSDVKESEIAGVQFFAFAVPGRTAVDISVRSDINAAPYGAPGYIQKVTSNLVSITWLNDEVKFYRGDGLSGLKLPKIWSYPGYIWDRSPSGTNPLLPQRIDHHGNYGGKFTDGKGDGSDLGQGVEKSWYPYCATGNNSAFTLFSECKKKEVTFTPYFWGDEECRNKAFSMMESAANKESYFIGYSGPRSAGCRDNVAPIRATYEIKYRMNIGDLFSNHCRYEMKVHFEGLNFSWMPYTRSNGDVITVSTQKAQDTGWITYNSKGKKEINIPYHTRIYFGSEMKEISGKKCKSINNSEGYIRYLKLTFIDPASGKEVTRTVIGNIEGSDYSWPATLHSKDNVGWYKWDDPRDANDTWKLHYAPTHTALMIKGDTAPNMKGHFFKYLHLID